MDIKPIHNDKDLKAALARVEALWDKEDVESLDELEVLSLLVSDYEKRTIPVGPVEPIEMLKFCMDQQGYKQKDLAILLGSRSRPSEILSGRRSLSVDMIRTISREWHIPVALLVGEGENKPVAPKTKHKVFIAEKKKPERLTKVKGLATIKKTKMSTGRFNLDKEVERLRSMEVATAKTVEKIHHKKGSH